MGTGHGRGGCGMTYFIYLFIYTVLIVRAIHNSMCSNALAETMSF